MSTMATSTKTLRNNRSKRTHDKQERDEILSPPLLLPQNKIVPHRSRVVSSTIAKIHL